MRNSINYNLKYFIMKMSSTKPMKNTMRKPSPLKFMGTDAVMSATKKVSDAVGAAAKKVKSAKAAAATKSVEGKPASRPGSAKPKAEMASKATPMKMKKSGMGKKC